MEFLDIELFNQKDLIKLLIRFSIDFVSHLLLLDCSILRQTEEKITYSPSLFLTFLLFSFVFY